MSSPSFTSPRLFVFSGAGLSAESGIPTFRSADGIWSKAAINKVCNLDTWLENRAEVYAFYNARLSEMGPARPNDAHRILAQWQTRWGPDRVQLLTQNVDDLLEKAGAQAVVHLHGDMHHYCCTACDHRFARNSAQWDEHLSCPACGDPQALKPGFTFFNEPAPAYAHLQAMRQTLTNEDVFVAVGTSFVIVTPLQILPPDRWCAHPRSFLVDPSPSEEMFGVVCAKPASVGLAEIERAIVAQMEGLPAPEQVADDASRRSGAESDNERGNTAGRITGWLDRALSALRMR